MGYKHPALTEIYSEIGFEHGTFGPAQFLPLVATLGELGYSSVEMQPNPVIRHDTGIPLPVIQSKILCWSPDKKSKLIQLADNTLVLNLPGAYTGWVNFRGEVEKILNVLELAGVRSFYSISLNTADQLNTQDPEFRIGKYLNCGGKRIPEIFKESREAVDITMGRGVLEQNGFNRQLRIAVRILSDSSQNIQFNSTFNNRLDGKPILSHLENLHTESNESFESLITDTVRNQIMGGKK